MSTRNFLADFPINAPCDADWESMTGDEYFRFCDHCRRSVHNLDQLTNKEIRRLVKKSRSRLCVRFYQSPVAQSAPVQISRRAPNRATLLAVGAFTATLGVTTAAMGSNLPAKQLGPKIYSSLALTDSSPVRFSATGGTIKGTIFDPAGAIIPGVKVTILDGDVQLINTTCTDSDGSYHFDGLEAGKYTLKFEAQGFTTLQLTDVQLFANDECRIDQTMNVAEATVTMGVVAIAPMEPLVKAAEEDDLDTVRLVLLTNSDANVRDKSTGLTALECAVRNANREMIQVLLWAKADVNSRGRDGQTALMMLNESVTPDIIWDLLNAGAKINFRDEDGDTVLMEAAQINNVEVLKTLIDAGAKINTANNEGKTSLMFAAEEGYVDNVRALLMAGADINARDKEGKTAMFYAKDNDHAAIQRLLISYGAIKDAPVEKQEH